MAGANRNSKASTWVCSTKSTAVWISQQLVVGENAFRPVTIFLIAHTSLREPGSPVLLPR